MSRKIIHLHILKVCSNAWGNWSPGDTTREIPERDACAMIDGGLAELVKPVPASPPAWSPPASSEPEVGPETDETDTDEDEQ